MADNSLLLLAVKRSLDLGRGALQGGNKFSSLYGISSLFQAEVETQYMSAFIETMVDECVTAIPPTLSSYRTEIVQSLEEAAAYETYLWADHQHAVCNSFYENNVGKFSLFTYLFAEAPNGNINCESLSIDLQFRLADIAITLTRIKKKLFGRKKKTTEVRYIKPAVKAVDFVNALAVVIAPLLEPSAGVQGPSELTNILREAASEAPDTYPSDAVRRTVYNPITKMSEVVTDPEVLKLMPGKWEKVVIRTNGQPVANSKYWEFDE